MAAQKHPPPAFDPDGGCFFYRAGFFPESLFLMPILKKNRLSFLTVAITLLLWAGQGRAESPVVRYDPATDLLSVTAVGSSLQDLMQKIGAVSGLSVTVSPAAEEMVTLTMVDRPLETGLRELARTLKLNHLFLHETRSSQTRLAAMRILPRRTAEKASPSGAATAPAVLTPAEKHRLSEEEILQRREAFIQRHEERPEPQKPAKFERKAGSPEDRRKRAAEKYQQRQAEGLRKTMRPPSAEKGAPVIPGIRRIEEKQKTDSDPSTP